MRSFVGVVAVPRVCWDRGTDGCRFGVGGRCDLWLWSICLLPIILCLRFGGWEEYETSLNDVRSLCCFWQCRDSDPLTITVLFET
jgi:hypothetical protein